MEWFDKLKTRSSTAEITRDADGVDFSVAYLTIKLNPC